MKFSPMTGKAVVQAKVAIADDYGEVLAGVGNVEFDGAELRRLHAEIGSMLDRSHTWSSSDGKRAVLQILQDGTWGVWSTDCAPNLGPLRNAAEYRQQVYAMRAAGMSLEVTP